MNTNTPVAAPRCPDQYSPFAKLYDGQQVLVTGGLGFVGSNVVRALNKLGARVRVLDDGFTGKLEYIAGCHNVEIVTGSVTDTNAVCNAMERTDYVFHLACRNIIVSTLDPQMDCLVNTTGTVNVLLAARDARVKRCVYSSSASVYGNSSVTPASESDPPNLLSPYAASKYASEGFCHAYYETYGLPVAVLRYSNVYGTMQQPDNPYCGVVSRFMDAALRGHPLHIYGDGEQTRDFTYIDDVVDATLLAGVSPRAVGRVFNVATGREVSVNQLASLIEAASGLECRKEFVPRRDIDTVRRRVLSVERIRSELRWVPRTPLETGLRQTFEWLRNECEHKAAVAHPTERIR